VDYFWMLLDQLPETGYPSGSIPVPGRQFGTWAFSSSAGLIWQPGAPRPAFPKGGVMFVAYYLNASGPWNRNRGVWGDPRNHTMEYWKRLLPVLDRAGIPRSEAFFTNAYVGLVKGDDPSVEHPGRKDKSFCRWCAGFLSEQIRVMQPCLVVAFGRRSEEALVGWKVARQLGLDPTKVMEIRHPSAPNWYATVNRETARLREAYRSCCNDS
jgi:hypothetical protein